MRHIYGWLDSSDTLLDKGNRELHAIRHKSSEEDEKNFIKWRHVPTNLNPTDIASKGSNKERIGEMCSKGPIWLLDHKIWPADIQVKAGGEIEKEAKAVKEVLTVSIEEGERAGQDSRKTWVLEINAHHSQDINICS